MPSSLPQGPAARASLLRAPALLAVLLLPATPAWAEDSPAITLEEVSVAGTGKAFGVAAPPGSAAAVIEHPVGQVVTAVGRENVIANRPATGIGAVLLNSPGVTVRQGNGARDVVISIRGNNARSTGVTRNMVVLEDGFVVTQPEGFTRFDLVDPRAYSRIDVFRGPQSALFGNFATGGALAFRTRTGREIDGYEVGTDAGSYGLLSNYFTVGGVSGPVEISLFASDVRGNGYQEHTGYDTQTVNLLASYTPTPDNRFTLKVIDNEVHADIAGRASLDEYRLNPFQRSCASAATAAPGCVTYSLFRNGAFGTRIPVTAAQIGLERKDRRTIVAARWEHDVDADTTWRIQAGFDERNINQAFYTSSGRGSIPSLNVLADVTHRSELFGLPALTYAALNLSALDGHSPTFNLTPFAGPRLGALIGDQFSQQANLGGRARTELALSESWTGVLGISAENTWIKGRNLAYSYTNGSLTRSLATADRSFLNVAPELALVYRPNEALAVRGRVATGYATPGASNLFVTSAGLPGNNTQLQTQENLGFDLGADWTPLPDLRLSLTGFYEFYRNELLSQSPGFGLLSYTFNAPASEHRGIEFGAEWLFGEGWRGTLAYTFDDQFYTDYVEQLSAGAAPVRFDRAGHAIPGVPAHQLLARIGYDVPAGPLAGLGAFAETIVQDGYYLDNANLLRVPGYAIVNLNIHYSRLLPAGYAKRIDLYGEVRNVFDTTYIASANPLANSLNATTGLQNGRDVLAATSGSIYAGAPRTFVAGMKLSF
ncbi:TonB-dependent receptor family protein [Methylobacterium organophilum]|uniref:Vitamin B12 transporter BtuB n=1 Tax=Methylobacterium organophilum TaxID=410 RepID=A0ABQ4T480_METOR|nr:TonB-dependent receptor [Methylobacterium organophilum]GJE25209.1 Vitamin B12 transporter BtuB [Methylobacterium organophilum]